MPIPHEFEGGATMADHIGPEDRLCRWCGEEVEHTNHKNADSTDYFDTDTVFDRMRADGSIAPKVG